MEMNKYKNFDEIIFSANSRLFTNSRAVSGNKIKNPAGEAGSNALFFA